MKTSTIYKQIAGIGIIILMSILPSCSNESITPYNTSKDITIEAIITNVKFAEGPIFSNGTLYFSDIEANKIYSWSEREGIKTVVSESGGANGLFINADNELVVCEGTNKRITAINKSLNTRILADSYNNMPFNEPNDLWIAPNGNIYFTDPIFKGTPTQSGENVYCIRKDNNQTLMVANDLVKPNGIIGNSNGTSLYVADYGASKIFKYTISSDGSLTNKQLFAALKADGLSIDSKENIYAASDRLMIYNMQGIPINSIEISGTLTNVFVSEEGLKTAYITTHNIIYKLTDF